MIEIADDGVYEERFEIELAAGEQLEIRAAPGRRPILVPVQSRNRPAEFRVMGPDGERPGVRIRGARGGARTGLRPGRHLDRGPPARAHGSLRRGPAAPLHARPGRARGWTSIRGASCALPAWSCAACPCPIAIASSVVGRIRVESAEAGFDPIPLTVVDSVIDACEPDGHALRGADGRRAWVSLSLQRVTVLGAADVAGAELVEDSIFTGPLGCERRQTGAVRFSFLPAGSRTPRRTACQPDDCPRAGSHGIAVTRALTAARVAPRFDAVRFGEPAYARLAADAAPEIARGAHDEGELGAYHDLWQALRVADLRARLQEFAPAGTDIDIRFAT